MFQSISPGLVRTEFYGRSRKWDDIEASKVAIDRLTSYGTVRMLQLLLKDACMVLHLEYTSILFLFQVLEADDVASAVKFVLSAPPRMEVSVMCTIYSSY